MSEDIAVISGEHERGGVLCNGGTVDLSSIARPGGPRVQLAVSEGYKFAICVLTRTGVEELRAKLLEWLEAHPDAT